MAASSPTRVKRLHRAVALRWTIAISAVAALILTAVLSVQMALGSDPALGPKLARHGSASQVATQTAAPTVLGSAPVTTAPTTVPASPLVAPAPAPAPAPVQTTTS